MKHHETKTTTTTHTVCTSRTCDLCGRKAEKGDEWTCGWKHEHNVNETEVQVVVRQKEGYNLPDCGSGTEYEIDLCPDCFRDRLVPWLRSQGAKVENKEWDW